MTKQISPLRLEDRHQIAELNVLFSRGLDHNDQATFLSIFADDIEYVSGPRRHAGLDQLTEFFSTRAATGRVSRHLCTGQSVTFTGDDSAVGTSTWLTYAGQGALPVQSALPFMVADVADEYRRVKDGWQITRREITPVFRNPDIAPPPAGGKS